ncbi:DNA-binding TFAR19-related protein [Meira miltonrushii]|uniref:DNA-binding TFAR19-related protein n=1 Tax=Meira miltonrushii TaxID=1280837 RepID=A0A316VN49_9BASI|nr:DNA-binding TFAR19-related protein [Meira miltonrushii]PWN36985.1 DNA-binding TFAR19-related protein [Meira miltonrushii]
MDDPELEAIRRARMAELQSRGGAGSPSGGYGGASAGGGIPGGNAGRGGSGKEQEDAEAQDEMKRQALSTILDPEARERLSRISLVKPSKARAIQDLLIRMAQSGQVRQKVTEQQLIGLLDQVEGQGQGGSGASSGGAGKITYTRKKTLDDDDDDFDL